MAQRAVSELPARSDEAAGAAEAVEPAGAGPAGLGRAAAVAAVGLLILGVFYTLYFAKSLLIPVAIALLLNLVLGPLVRRLARVGLPEGVGAALVLVAVLGIVAVGVLRLAGPAADWLDRAPVIVWEAQWKLRGLIESVEEVRAATKEVEQLAKVGNAEAEEQAEAVVVEGPGVIQTILAGTTTFLASAVITIVLLYFLLASGDLFLGKLVRVLPTFHDKKRAVEITRRAERDISRYLLTVTLVNTGLGVATGTAMYLLGMPNAFLWGVVAGVLNFIPYLGALVTIVVLALIAVLTFDEPARMALPPLVFFVFTTLEGQLISPAVHGRRLALNPVVVFVALLAWGWLWGIPGILLAVPLLATFKIICDNIEPLAPIAEFLDRA